MGNDLSKLAKLLYDPIFVPLVETTTDEIKFLQFDTSEVSMVLGFSSALNLARFCGADVEFLELDARTLFEKLSAQNLSLGFDIDEEGEIYSPDEMLNLLASLENDFDNETSSNIKFMLASHEKDLLPAFETMLAEFSPAPCAYLVGNAQSEPIIAISAHDIKTHHGLLAQLHDVARRVETTRHISIMVYHDLSTLGEDFEKFALKISPHKPVQIMKPPILRY